MEVKVRHIYDQPVDAVFTKLGDKASVARNDWKAITPGAGAATACSR